MPAAHFDGIRLPELMRFRDGTPVRSPGDWPRRREELRQVLLDLQYGPLPPAPERTAGLPLIAHYDHVHHAQHSQFRVLVRAAGREFSFLLDLLCPPGKKGPFPTILRGDWCWRKLPLEPLRMILTRGYAVAEFNRVELAPDNARRDTGLAAVFPDWTGGALAGWAWGYHRSVDVLAALPEVDPTRLVVTGHSRGGKAALLAGALDERVAVTNPNNSGCGGAGSYHCQAPRSEDLAAIVKQFAFWFAPGFRRWAGRERELPFDQHFLKALVAPRALLSTEALGDLWANPEGAWQTHQAAAPAFRLLGAEERLGILYRDGIHEQNLRDWEALLDFCDLQFFQKPCGLDFRIGLTQPVVR